MEPVASEQQVLARHETAALYERTTLLLTVLVGGSLPGWWLGVDGRLPRSSGALLWVAVFLPALLAAVLLLSTTYFAGRRASPGRASHRPGILVGLSAGLFLLMALILALPPVVFPRLSHSLTDNLEETPATLNVLRRRAMEHADPIRRRQAARDFFMVTRRRVLYLDPAANPGLFEPTPTDVRALKLYEWIASRPGGRGWERRMMAGVDAGLVLLVLTGVPLSIRLGRRHADSGPEPPPL